MKSTNSTPSWFHHYPRKGVGHPARWPDNMSCEGSKDKMMPNCQRFRTGGIQVIGCNRNGLMVKADGANA